MHKQQRLDALLVVSLLGFVAMRSMPYEFRDAHPVWSILAMLSFSPLVVFWLWSFSLISRYAPKEHRVYLYVATVLLPLLAVPYVYGKFGRPQYERIVAQK